MRIIFFREPWSEKRIPPFGFSDEEWKFIESSEGYAKEVERFTVVCLQRSISL
jgi:hypothetical protein